MKLTREEYIKAKEILYEYIINVIGERKKPMEALGATVVIDNLIKEHFDNLPLKKDEILELIKENNNHGATIFDSKNNNEIFVTYDLYHDLCVFYFGDEWSWPFEYEENRYYRSKVSEK